MGFLDSIRRTNDGQHSTTESKVYLESNAPPSWPKVPNEIDLGKPFSLNLIKFASSLKKGLEKSNLNCRLISIAQTKLGEKGIIDASCEVAENGKIVPVILYLNGSRGEANDFTTIIEFFRERNESAPIYFAPKTLSSDSQGFPFRAFQADDLSKVENVELAGKYAMWWQSKDKKNFIGSKTQQTISRIYRNLDGIETYVFAALGRNIGICNEETSRLRLPVDEFSIPVKGPENKIFLLCASQEKGIRFKFNVKETPDGYRDNFLSTFADYAELWKKEALKREFELDENKDTKPLKWYEFLEKILRDNEGKGEETDMIGTSVFK